MLALLRSLPAPALPYLIGLALVSVSSAAVGEPRPALLGYGMKSCERFVAVAAGAVDGRAAEDGAYQGYRQWLAGFVSGLNLATGMDVLRGVALDRVLGRIESDCRDRPDLDVFNATMGVVGPLMRLDPPARAGTR